MSDFTSDSLLSGVSLDNILAPQFQMHLDDANNHMFFGLPSSNNSTPPQLDTPPENSVAAALVNSMAALQMSARSGMCTGCKQGITASHYCEDCSHHLCQGCTNAHITMHCFASHKVVPIAISSGFSDNSRADALEAENAGKPSTFPMCATHPSEVLTHYCEKCDKTLCETCISVHFSTDPSHSVLTVEQAAEQVATKFRLQLEDLGVKQASLPETLKAIGVAQQRLKSSQTVAFQMIQAHVKSLMALIEQRRKALIDEIDMVIQARMGQISSVNRQVQCMSVKLNETVEWMDRMLSTSGPLEIIAFRSLLETRLELLLQFDTELVEKTLNRLSDVQLKSFPPLARQAFIQDLIAEAQNNPVEVPMIENRPVRARQELSPPQGLHQSRILGRSVTPGMPIGTNPIGISSYASSFDTGISMRNVSSVNRLDDHSIFAPSSAPMPSAFPGDFGYDKWASSFDASMGFMAGSEMNLDVDKGCFNSAICLPINRTQVHRSKMTYNCKFGEFGVMEGQFTEPSGVAVNAQGDIIVADTNNHRIQVFDKDGRFKFQFGECGKRDGQLLYPNRVAVSKISGDFVVTERSPTHQIQVFNQYGQFLRKFGATVLQHPRGVCVDQNGRIVVVECKVMRVIIFDMFGNVLQKFSCARNLEFPNGVCTNDRNEILISDNRAHCIKVFSYEGICLRQIGGEGITNYPIGVCINSRGDIVVADNHNNFNLTVFSPDGQLLTALESKVKHAQCFDVALIDDSSIIVASKDYRLYLYRFV